MKIPVQKESEILPVDENLLAILKWRLGLIGPGDRWYPVLLRYILAMSQRIEGMGHDPSKIPASPNGYHPVSLPHGEGSIEDCYTGKVASMHFDRFGDFAGFVLLTEKGEKHAFPSVEYEVEELIYRAWRERFVITICVHPHRRHVVSVTLLRAPRQRGPS